MERQQSYESYMLKDEWSVYYIRACLSTDCCQSFGVVWIERSRICTFWRTKGRYTGTQWRGEDEMHPDEVHLFSLGGGHICNKTGQTMTLVPKVLATDLSRVIRIYLSIVCMYLSVLLSFFLYLSLYPPLPEEDRSLSKDSLSLPWVIRFVFAEKMLSFGTGPL